jgi:hypothetical protein
VPFPQAGQLADSLLILFDLSASGYIDDRIGRFGAIQSSSCVATQPLFHLVKCSDEPHRCLRVVYKAFAK